MNLLPKKLFICCTLLIISLGWVKANPTSRDSLLAVLQNPQPDSALFQNYILLGEAYAKTQKDSSGIFLHKAGQLLKNFKVPRQKARFQRKLGIAYRKSQNADSAAVYLLLALDYFRKNGPEKDRFYTYLETGSVFFELEDRNKAIDLYEAALKLDLSRVDSAKLSDLYTNLGLAYQYTSRFKEAIHYHFEGLRVVIAMHDISGEASSYNNLGVCYLELGQYDDALQQYEKALNIYRQLQDTAQILRRTYAIGGALFGKKMYPEALTYLNRALNMARASNDKLTILSCYQVMGLIYIKLENYPEAERVLRLAETEFPAKGSKRMLIYIKSNLSVLYLNWGTNVQANRKQHLNQAITFSKETILLAKEIDFLMLEKKSYEVLYKAYNELGQHKEAMDYALTYMTLSDSLLNAEKQNAIVEMEAKYEAEKKDLEIDLLNKDKTIANMELSASKEAQKSQRDVIYALLAGVLFISALGMVIFRLYRQKQKANQQLVSQNKTIVQQRDENEVLLKEIHHRVKNNLQIISSLLDLQSGKALDENSRMLTIDSQSRVKAMSLVHELLYQNNNLAEIDMNVYTAKLAAQIQSINHVEGKVYRLDIPHDMIVDIDTAIPLGLILTELLTNAFKYAQSSPEAKPEVEIGIQREKADHLRVRVRDNGPGLPDEQALKAPRSLGLRLVKTLTKQLGGTLQYTYESGACFTLHFVNEKSYP